ncbi:hypothetical protein EAS61_15910 [Bradyrhizobium zhanjiangense]|uniref:Uncharacterized protein n=1 Tax=Bradyrhizobium zhanjiangense TaxID=1325107 RepID=A0A4Q0SPE6_9BRAD|nr:hypothetical protein [Bradyrhizobium zhanjiangense]RXG96742.1 hypothetical protein EAS61_15910 [Bradyrhizobium zhanjiangense]RXG99921.1 hypothetical protein EAS62_01695 [Bradyrhizobium zhanjiangense]RXH41753.1 hypothetical protein XH94_05445 [Bradyrhizobium zhanjiangense]
MADAGIARTWPQSPISANGKGGHDACAGGEKPFDLARPVGLSYANSAHNGEALGRIAKALREPS